MLIDTHAHLFWESYKQDYQEVIDRAIETGLSIIINVGTDPETSKEAVELKSDKIKFLSSIGIHPHEYTKYTSDSDVSIQQDIERVEKIYQANISKVIGVGECGLDYFFENNPDFISSSLSIDQIKVIQKKLFLAQIKLSKKLNLPLLIHCREAWSDIFENLQGTKGLFHTFSGSFKDAKRALALGYFLSFSAIITYPKNDYLREIIKNTPLDKILTETDCPFLPPQSKRGQRNEPETIKEIVELIAGLKEISFEQTANQISQNAKKLFAI